MLPPSERSLIGLLIWIGLFSTVGLLLTIFAIGSVHGAPPVRLIAEQEEFELRAMLPRVDNAEVQRLLNADDLIWFTDREMPRAYQHKDFFHSPDYNISNSNENNLRGQRIGKDPVGNGNKDFPWNEPGGLDDVKGLEVFRFIKLPLAGVSTGRGGSTDGTRVTGLAGNRAYWPVVFFRGPNEGSNLHAQGLNVTLGEGGGPASRNRWMFPVGTVLGELLCTAHAEALYPFELRLRFRQTDHWEVDAYRPCPTASSMVRKIQTLRPDWIFDDELTKLVRDLEKPRQPKAEQVTNFLTGRFDRTQVAFLGNQAVRDRIAFSAEVAREVLPAFPEDLSRDLLTKGEWKTASGEVWRTGSNGVEVSAPTTVTPGLQPVPFGYAAHIFKVDSESCMNCHKHTGANVRLFDANRGWYGRIRGNDGIFSFHPIDPESISGNGRRLDVRLRPEFVAAGVAAPYDPASHSGSVYRALDQFPTR